MDLRPQAAGFSPTLVVASWIGGEARLGKDTSERRSPVDSNDLVTIAPVSSKDDVREACEKSVAAQARWAKVPAPDRARVIGRLGELLRRRKEEIARFVSREIGKPLREARGSVQEAIDTCEFFQSEGRRLYGQTVPSELSDKELFTYRRPIGVVGAITAGNFPVAVPSWKIVPALLCGNSVVWKPSEDAPGTAALFAELWRIAGLPSGVLSVVYGSGKDGAGQWLVEMVDAGLVQKISFTGSTVVGRWIGEVCGRNLQVPSLELGGKNPLVVLRDANLDLAVDGAIWASFGTAGQRCTSAGNIILDAPIAKAFRDRFLDRAKKLRIGDPRRDDVDYGPMMSERFLEKFLGQRAIGVADGAKLLLEGDRVAPKSPPSAFSGNAEHGLYVTPRIFDGVTMKMRVAQEECFGPTINLVEVEGLGEALAAANGTPYGLSSAIYTEDPAAMLRFKSEIRAGMTSINNSTTGAEAHLPFGGNGWSGNGTRESGIWVLDAYTRWQAVNVDLRGALQLAQIDVDPAAPADPPDWAEIA